MPFWNANHWSRINFFWAEREKDRKKEIERTSEQTVNFTNKNNNNSVNQTNFKTPVNQTAEIEPTTKIILRINKIAIVNNKNNCNNRREKRNTNNQPINQSANHTYIYQLLQNNTK